LQESGKTPITKRKLRTRKYAEKKLDEITSMMEKLFIGEDSKSEDSEIIRQLKEKFQSTTERSIRVQILTILPQSLSIRKIETEFGVSNFMARTAKKLV
jgi:sugar-specific transcriptional regulator TrmB